jgi:hypothetical protein
MKTLPALLILWTGLAGSSAEYKRASQKIEMIREDRAKPKSTVVFTPSEINAYAATELHAAVPSGIRNPKVTLNSSGATGTAMIDFLAVRKSQGEPPGRIMSWLLKG